MTGESFQKAVVLPADLLCAQRHALKNTIAANTVADVDRVGRLMLSNLNGQMKGFIARIDAELSRGAQHAGHYGPNGWAPTLADLIEESRLQRSFASRQSQQMMEEVG